MFIVKQNQIKELQVIPTSSFLKRVEKFIIANNPSQKLSGSYLTIIVKEKYLLAVESGLKTERDIVAFIVKQIENI
jgi:hypothetical protein